MKAVIIHGQSHEGSTCHMARLLAKKLDAEITEFFLPRDFGEFCRGCSVCFMKGEEYCPHYKQLKPITDVIDESDVIILASPVYVYHASGPMKALLDHYGYRWMVHRPEEKMFSKQAVVMCTAAGSGLKHANKDMADSTFFWGCAKTYKLGVAVAASSWEEIDPRIMAKIERKATEVADKVKNNYGKARPGLKTKFFFSIMRMMQKDGWNKTDQNYWKEKGWLEKECPWNK